MICPGIPGAGKTILAATVIDHLLERSASDSSIALAYVYFNFRRESEQTFEELLAMILRQLVKSRKLGSKTLREGYENRSIGSNMARPNLKLIRDGLHETTGDIPKVYIVVDALDECQVQGGTRTRFLSELIDIQKKNGPNIMVTSRFIPEIDLEETSMRETLEIRANQDDIGQYLQSRMHELRPFARKRLDLQREIIDTISTTVEGM